MPIGLYLRAAEWLAAFLVLAAVTWWVYSRGEAHVQAEWDAERAQLQAAHLAEVERLQAVNRTVEVRYMDRVRTVQAAAQVITKEVPKYVTAIDNSRCTIPDGFVGLLNAAAQGRVPEAGGAAVTDGAGTPVGAIPAALHAE